MDWKIEYSSAAKEDLRRIFRHLFGVQHNSFGYGTRTARNMAASRIEVMQMNAARIAAAPHIGTVRVIRDREFRHVTIDRAIYWFTLDEPTKTVNIEGIFHGGQDHLGRILARLR